MLKQFLVIAATTFSYTTFSQVELQTGAPEVSFPLYTISDKDGISTAVSLNYTGGNGIKTESVASRVGTGWDLSYGGFITRSVRGEPDDQKQHGTFDPINDRINYIKNYYPNGYLYSEFNPNEHVTNEAAVGKLYECRARELPLPKYIADRQIDVFTANLNGRVLDFSILKTAGLQDVLFYNSKDSKLKVEIVYDNNSNVNNIRTTIKSFIILDELGTKYLFEDMELSEVVKYEKREYYDGSNNPPLSSMMGYYCVGPDNSGPAYAGLVVYRGVRSGQYVCNRWMLTKIVNPLTNQGISFEYDEQSLVFDGATRVVNTSSENSGSFSVTIDFISSKLKRIKAISNVNGDKIKFEYINDRKDLPGDKALSKISFYKRSEIVSSYNFTYKYFYKSSVIDPATSVPSSDKVFLRLALHSFQKIGLNSETEPSCIFSYVTPPVDSDEIFPPQFCYFKDHWGYYNNSGVVGGFWNTSYIPELGKPYVRMVYTSFLGNPMQFRNFNYDGVPYGSFGLLEGIRYPTGSVLKYKYEPNLAYFNGGNIQVGGFRVKEILQHDGISSNNDRTTQYSYIKENSTNSSAWGYEPPIYTDNSTQTIFKCLLNNERFSGVSAVDAFQLVELSHTIQYGSYMLANKSLFASNIPYQNMAMGAALQILVAILLDLFSPSEGPYKDYTVTSTYNDPLNYNNPLPFQYSRVEVKNTTNNVNNGSDIFEFTSENDHAMEYKVCAATSERQRYWPGNYGLLKSITNKDANGLAIKKVENKYSFASGTSYELANPSAASLQWKPLKRISICSYMTSTASTLAHDQIVNNFYYPLIGSIFLEEIKETHQDQTNNAVVKTTHFEYNDFYQVKSKFTYNSKGEKVESFYRYINDYDINGPINLLKSAAVNNIATPVVTETYLYKTPVNKYLISGAITEYGTLSNGDVKPIKKYQLKLNAPLSNLSINPFSGSQLIRDAAYYKLVSEMVYDADGNAVGSNSKSEVGSNIFTPERSSLIYDNDYPFYVLATATNCSRDDIAYTSFEHSAQNNNWTYPENQRYNLDWMTGAKSFKFDNLVRSIQRYSLNPGVKYKLTFWLKNLSGPNGVIYNNLVYVNKNQQTQSGALVNNITPSLVYNNAATGWSLYECSITGASIISVHNQNPANPSVGLPILIDEVRLYPEGAGMSTATYNNLGWKTASVDANNKIEYFEYDGLGRIRLVRDENRNIVKTFEYNFKQ